MKTSLFSGPRVSCQSLSDYVRKIKYLPSGLSELVPVYRSILLLDPEDQRPRLERLGLLTSCRGRYLGLRGLSDHVVTFCPFRSNRPRRLSCARVSSTSIPTSPSCVTVETSRSQSVVERFLRWCQASSLTYPLSHTPSTTHFLVEVLVPSFEVQRRSLPLSSRLWTQVDEITRRKQLPDSTCRLERLRRRRTVSVTGSLWKGLVVRQKERSIDNKYPF